MDKQQILIVDDEEVNRELLRMMFDTDYDILEAADGGQAVEQIEKHGDPLVCVAGRTGDDVFADRTRMSRASGNGEVGDGF